MDVGLASQDRDVRARIAGAHGSHQREGPVGSPASQRHQQPHVELGGHDRAGEDDSRARQRLQLGVHAAVVERLREELGVRHVRHRRDLVRDLTQPLSQRLGGGEHRVRALHEALLGGAEAGGVDALLGRHVVHAVVDDERRREHVEQRLRLRVVRPEDGGGHAQPAGRTAHEPRQQAGIERAHGGEAVQRNHERGEDVDAVDLARRCNAAAQAPQDALEVTRGELRLTQPERLDEQHPVVARQPRHQVVLIGLQLGLPVGEADADDVPVAELHSCGIRRSRMRSNSAWACS